jgi:hypothetical protein
MRGSSAGAACVLLTAVLGRAADAPDLTQIDRRAPKEPSYTSSRPLYGLLVCGPKAQGRVWMVLDRSKPDAEAYDVLYADLNANGDLTERGERFVGEVEGNSARFRLPDLKDPASDSVHTNFTARVSGGSDPTVMLSVAWRGQRKMGGGYPQDPENGYMKFGTAPSNAPVMWANGDDPYRFQRWYGGRLPIGGEEDFKVFVGQPGSGANSFWAFQEHFLPESEGVQATLVYRDAQDKERRVTCMLKERC